MNSVLVLGLNPAWQRLLTLSALVPGNVHRVEESCEFASGKGINCARVLTNLGVRPRLIHVLGGVAGNRIQQELRQCGVEQQLVSIAGPTRICTTLAVPASAQEGGQSTELIEPSPTLSSEEAASLRARLQESWGNVSRVAVCGSFPEGIPADFCAALPLAGKSLYVDTVRGVDAWMEQGVELLKVNVQELMAIGKRLGLALDERMPYVEMAARLRSRWPVRHLVVTAGAAGAWLVDREERCWFAAALPSVRLRNAIGAGDAFLAGWIAEASVEASPEECLCAGAALAQARCEVMLPWEFSPERYTELRTLQRSALRRLA